MSRLRKLCFSLVLAATTISIGHAALAAGYVQTVGSGCQSIDNDRSVWTAAGGLENTNTTLMRRVNCPLSLGTQPNSAFTITQLAVWYKDSHASSPFSCFANAVFADGSAYQSSTKYTCSQGGGCPDSTSSYTGRSFLTWSAAELGSWLSTLGPTLHYSVTCYVPPTNSSNITSGIHTVYATF